LRAQGAGVLSFCLMPSVHCTLTLVPDYRTILLVSLAQPVNVAVFSACGNDLWERHTHRRVSQSEEE
jgi:hypothetical protein